MYWVELGLIAVFFLLAWLLRKKMKSFDHLLLFISGIILFVLFIIRKAGKIDFVAGAILMAAVALFLTIVYVRHRFTKELNETNTKSLTPVEVDLAAVDVIKHQELAEDTENGEKLGFRKLKDFTISEYTYLNYHRIMEKDKTIMRIEQFLAPGFLGVFPCRLLKFCEFFTYFSDKSSLTTLDFSVRLPVKFPENVLVQMFPDVTIAELYEKHMKKIKELSDRRVPQQISVDDYLKVKILN